MPAPIIDGLITFIAQQLNISVWDGEVPRYDVNGNPINPTSIVAPKDWPVVRVTMPESGFSRTWTTEDPYTDEGDVTIQVWATGRSAAETQMNSIEALLAQAINWSQIPLTGGSSDNPYYVIQLLLKSWTSVQLEGERTASGELLYRCDLNYSCMIHGAISTA